MPRRRWLIAAALVVCVAAVGAFAVIWRPVIAPIAPPATASFPAAQVARGATLAAIGDCAVCHTTAHGQPFAGGLPLPTPFGTIYATNITPDPETGIGTWSEAAFRRAMRDGIARDGRHLYPALPYPHFTRATDDDIAAIYAFLMTRAPARAVAPPNGLPFPLNIRAAVAGWNVLFLRPGVWTPDPAQSAEWNRGAYLVEALGHCSACHTPNNALGAEQANAAFAGGEAEGWSAPALQLASPAGIPWTVDQLDAYLRTGLARDHGAAAGPMRPVAEELAHVPPADVHAIAVYVAAMMPKTAATPPPLQPAGVADNAIFAGACGSCHAPDAPMTRAGAPSLSLSSVVNAPTPRDAIHMVLNGIPWREGAAGPYMPGFAATLSDQQVAQVVAYIRSHFSHGPAWTDLESQVRDARKDGGA